LFGLALLDNSSVNRTSLNYLITAQMQYSDGGFLGRPGLASHRSLILTV